MKFTHTEAHIQTHLHSYTGVGLAKKKNNGEEAMKVLILQCKACILLSSPEEVVKIHKEVHEGRGA